MTNKHVIAIEKTGEKLSRLQMQFNSYTQKIDAMKQFITQAKINLDFGRNLFNEKIVAVHTKMRDVDIDIIYVLDKHFEDPKASKAFKKNISYYIVAEVPAMIEATDEEKLKAIYVKHNGQSYDEEMEEKNSEANDMMKNMFGFDMNDPEKMAEFMNKQKGGSFQDFMNSMLGGMAGMGNDKNDQKTAKNENHEQRQSKKKTAAQVAKELKEEQEAKNIGQASRKIYTELVKQFHPDREHDELERERKTEIMKRITIAYEKNDLFDLLKLQLEYLQIDKDHINKLADDKLKYYNKILKEQLEELQDELAEVTESGNPFQMSFFDKYCRGTQAEITKRIEKERKAANKGLKHIEEKRSFMYDKESATYFLSDFKKEHQREMKSMRGGFGFGF